MDKKNSKKKVLWALGIVFLLLVIVVIIYFVIGYRNDQIESKKKIDSVISSYNTFKEHIDNFNKERDNFYQVVMKDMYYEDLKNNVTYIRINCFLISDYKGFTFIINRNIRI